MQRRVNVVEDLDGNKIVVIHDVIFQGKRSVEWEDVDTVNSFSQIQDTVNSFSQIQFYT